MGKGMTQELEKMANEVLERLVRKVFYKNKIKKTELEIIKTALKSVSASATESAALKCSVMARMAGHENLEKIIKKEFSL